MVNVWGDSIGAGVVYKLSTAELQDEKETKEAIITNNVELTSNGFDNHAFTNNEEKDASVLVNVKQTGDKDTFDERL